MAKSFLIRVKPGSRPPSTAKQPPQVIPVDSIFGHVVAQMQARIVPQAPAGQDEAVAKFMVFPSGQSESLAPGQVETESRFSQGHPGCLPDGQSSSPERPRLIRHIARLFMLATHRKVALIADEPIRLRRFKDGLGAAAASDRPWVLGKDLMRDANPIRTDPVVIVNETDKFVACLEKASATCVRETLHRFAHDAQWKRTIRRPQLPCDRARVVGGTVVHHDHLETDPAWNLLGGEMRKSRRQLRGAVVATHDHAGTRLIDQTTTPKLPIEIADDGASGPGRAAEAATAGGHRDAPDSRNGEECTD